MEKIPLDDILSPEVGTAIDFEITFAALLATTLLTAPSVSPPLSMFTTSSALLLLFFTLIRRMAHINSYSRTEELIGRTTTIITFLTSYSLLYLALIFGHHLNGVLPLRPSTLALLTLTIVAPFAVAIYELFFRDFVLLLAIFTYNKHVENRGTFLGRRALDLTHWIIPNSALSKEEYPDQLKGISELKSESPSKRALSERIGSLIGSLLGIVVFIGVFSTGVLALKWLLPDQSFLQTVRIVVIGLLLGLATNFSLVVTRFLYGRYGRTPYNQIIPPQRYILYSLLLYGVFLIHIAYESQLQLVPRLGLF